MSASSTWLLPRAPSLLSVSRASVALRFGRKPYDDGRKSASKIGSSTSFAAICTTRSRIVGMPRGLCPPSPFGMYRRKTGFGRYVPARSATAISSKKSVTPCCSISTKVWASTPAEPRFRLTRFHASWRTSPLQIRSTSAWKRLPGCRLAATHSRRCSCRTLSIGSRRSGWLGPDPPAMPSRLPALSTRPPQGPFPPATLFVVAIHGTTTPSDSRCTELAFTFGLYEPPRPDPGRADGPLVFRTPP